MIADDHRMFAEALTAILSTDARINVVAQAGDGREAVELARKLRPDVVVMDVAMPVMDGIDATRTIRQRAPGDGRRRGHRLRGDQRRLPRPRGGRGCVRDKGPDRRGSRARDPRGRRALDPPSYNPGRMLPVFAVIHVLLSAALVGLILMHSGRDSGLAGMGFTPQSQGGTHIVERNLTRLTLLVAVLFFLNTVLLFRLLQ